MDNVKVKDMKVGHIYVMSPRLLGDSMEGWRATYLYLGRSQQTKSFVYLFIGGLQSPKLETEEDVYKQINLYCDGSSYHEFLELRKSNKKVYEMQKYAYLNAFEFDINSPYLNNSTKSRILMALSR